MSIFRHIHFKACMNVPCPFGQILLIKLETAPPQGRRSRCLQAELGNKVAMSSLPNGTSKTGPRSKRSKKWRPRRRPVTKSRQAKARPVTTRLSRSSGCRPQRTDAPGSGRPGECAARRTASLYGMRFCAHRAGGPASVQPAAGASAPRLLLYTGAAPRAWASRDTPPPGLPPCSVC